MVSLKGPVSLGKRVNLATLVSLAGKGGQVAGGMYPRLALFLWTAVRRYTTSGAIQLHSIRRAQATNSRRPHLPLRRENGVSQAKWKIDSLYSRRTPARTCVARHGLIGTIYSLDWRF